MRDIRRGTGKRGLWKRPTGYRAGADIGYCYKRQPAHRERPHASGRLVRCHSYEQHGRQKQQALSHTIHHTSCLDDARTHSGFQMAPHDSPARLKAIPAHHWREALTPAPSVHERVKYASGAANLPQTQAAEWMLEIRSTRLHPNCATTAMRSRSSIEIRGSIFVAVQPKGVDLCPKSMGRTHTLYHT